MDLRPGLCAGCRHHRIVASQRGSRFLLCERSRVDPSFPRYPSLPVLTCRGFETAPAEHTETEEGTRP
jgi:hypothetical protein